MHEKDRAPNKAWSSSREPALSLILPTHDNSERLSRHLPTLRAYLKKLGVPFEILICDDGSRDPGTVHALSEKYGCRLVRLNENRGKGAAVRAGMKAAKGRVRLFTDNDVPFQLSVIGDFFRLLDREDADVVCGDRRLARSRYFDRISWARRQESRIFSLMVSWSKMDKATDTQCGIKGFRAEVAEDLFSVCRIDRFAFDVELLHVAALHGYRVKRRPVRLRVQERSQLRPLLDGMGMVWDLLRMAWYDHLGLYLPKRKEPRRADFLRTLPK